MRAKSPRVQSVDERAEVRPLLDGIRERHLVPSSARAFAVSISRSGCTTTAVSPAGTGSCSTSGGLAPADQHESAADRRRDVVRVSRPGAEPFALECARDERRQRRAPRRAARPRRRPPRRRWRRCRRDRSRAAVPFGCAARCLAARRASSSSARDRDAGRVLRAVARQTAAVALDVLDRDDLRAPGRRPSAKRAVTSSPGVSSAKPSTSNPHATLETVAGAKRSQQVMCV